MSATKIALVGVSLEDQLALAALEEEYELVVSDRCSELPPVNVVITPNTEQVRRELPQVARVQVCEERNAIEQVGRGAQAHAFIERPIDADVAQQAISHALSNSGLLDDPRILAIIEDLGTLPAMPRTYHALTRVLNSRSANLARAARVIEQDVSISSRVLQLVNSSLYNLTRKVASVDHAVSLLGLQTVRTLVLSIEVMDAFPKNQLPGFSIEAIQSRSHARAILSKAIPPRNHADAAYTVGLLSTLGRMVLATGAPEQYAQVLELTRGDDYRSAENEVFGINQEDLGAWLLASWGLPTEVVDAVRYGNEPPMESTFQPLEVSTYLAEQLLVEATERNEGLDEDPLLAHLIQGLYTGSGSTTSLELLRELATTLQSGQVEPPRRKRAG